MKSKKDLMGFKKAMSYLLDLLCYSYYVKSDGLVSDSTFDEIEGLYCKMFNKTEAELRGVELEVCYSYGVKFIYDKLKGGNV